MASPTDLPTGAVEVTRVFQINEAPVPLRDFIDFIEEGLVETGHVPDRPYKASTDEVLSPAVLLEEFAARYPDDPLRKVALLAAVRLRALPRV